MKRIKVVGSNGVRLNGKKAARVRVREVPYNFGTEIEENRKSVNGTGTAMITPKVWEWATKKFGKGSKVTWTSKDAAIRKQLIDIHTAKNKGRDIIHILIKPLGDTILVINHGTGAMGVKPVKKMFKFSDYSASMKKAKKKLKLGEIWIRWVGQENSVEDVTDNGYKDYDIAAAEVIADNINALGRDVFEEELESDGLTEQTLHDALVKYMERHG